MEWIGRVGVALQPLLDRLILHLLQGRVLHADETPVAQLDPGSGKTRRAYLWAYRSNDFELGPRITCSTIKPAAAASTHKASLPVGKVISLSTITPVTNRCSPSSAIAPNSAGFAHARRKFFDLHQANASTVAFEALQRIGELYAVEAEAKSLSTEARQQLCTEKSIPILQSLHDWLLQTRTQTADGGGTAKAIDYTLKRWQSLIRTVTGPGRESRILRSN